MSAQLEADAEERAMEAEALEAIFMESYSMDGATYRLELEPESDEAHVACVLEASCPEDSPSSKPPTIKIADVRGLGRPPDAERDGQRAEAPGLRVEAPAAQGHEAAQVPRRQPGARARDARRRHAPQRARCLLYTSPSPRDRG